MDEEKTKEELPTTNSKDGDKPKTINLYEQTNNATERLEIANAKTEELLNRQEELYQNQKLAGRAEAGEVAPAKKEMTDTEYAEALQRGEVNPLKEDGIFK